MEGKEKVETVIDENFNLEEEINKMPGDLYLKMTVLPLLHNALNMCEMIRPPDPIAFISNFMLINKNTSKKMEDVVKDIPKEEMINMEHDLLFSADESRLEKHSEEEGNVMPKEGNVDDEKNNTKNENNQLNNSKDAKKA